MKLKFLVNKTHIRLVRALRDYPLQVIGAAFVAFMFLFILTIGLLSPDHAHGQSFRDSNAPSAVAPETEPPRPGLTAAVSYADLVEKVVPSVVTVRSERKVAPEKSEMDAPDDLMRRFFGGRVPQIEPSRPQVERGLGSGVIVAVDGTIVTNNHVVAGATSVKIDLADRRTFDAKIVGTDPASDLAVLKIETGADLPALGLGDSDKVRVGDVVLAIGNPLGLRQTVTSGIISAKGRQTGLSDGSFEDFLQTDAPINHGNSGGALVNLNGELIGINSQIMSPSGGNIGIGFAIPSNMTRSVIEQLERDGKVRRGMLGVGIQDVTADLAENFGLKDLTGVIVNSVKDRSPAEKGGIKAGDVIVSLNETPVRDGNDLRNRVAQTAPGTEVTVGIKRGGSDQSVKVTLGEMPSGNATETGDAKPGDGQKGKLGITIEPLTPELAAKLGVSSGVVISDVQSGGAAEDSGLQPGDVIVEANRRPVKSADDFKAALSEGKPGIALLLISRKGQTAFVTVKY